MKKAIRLALIVGMTLASTGRAYEWEHPYDDPPPKKPNMYVTPIKDTLILTPTPKESVWVQPMQSYPCIGKANIGWLIIYDDSKGVKRAGLVPWRDRMNNLTAEEDGNNLKIRSGTITRIGQGGALLKQGFPYFLIKEDEQNQTLLYYFASYTQEVIVAKAQMCTKIDEATAMKLLSDIKNKSIEHTQPTGESHATIINSCSCDNPVMSSSVSSGRQSSDDSEGKSASKCTTCNGAGKIRVASRGLTSSWTKCPNCGGTGKNNHDSLAIERGSRNYMSAADLKNDFQNHLNRMPTPSSSAGAFDSMANGTFPGH